MRPIQFLLLLSLFVALPLILTCFSLVHSAKASSEPLGPSFRPRQSRFRALFSFTTPSSLFPPSAVISLTNDNSTFFLARPAAFGPSLPSHGLSGQLWVGKGFGEEILLSDGIYVHGYELGCSDVPGWNEEHRNRLENGAIKGGNTLPKSNPPSKPVRSKRNVERSSQGLDEEAAIDGTDDHLHQPLPDSNPTLNTRPGAPADASSNRGSTHTHADIESLQESADIAGKIAMLSRGGCGFLEKVKWVQRRGGVGLIVGDNQPGGQLTIMYAKGDTSNVTIPSLFTSYNAAHLLSSLVPPEKKAEDYAENSDPAKIALASKPKSAKTEKVKGINSQHDVPGKPKKAKSNHEVESNNQWVQNVLSAVGLSDGETDVDDSRRPPSSGNIDWILQDNWDDDSPVVTTTASSAAQDSVAKSTAAVSKSTNIRSSTTKRVGNDDFVIGVQDWRDTELVAPKATPVNEPMHQNGKHVKLPLQSSSTSSSRIAVETARKGSIITPGSGEYDHQKHAFRVGRKGKSSAGLSKDEVPSEDPRSLRDKFRSLFYDTHERAIVHPKPKDDEAGSVQRQGRKL